MEGKRAKFDVPVEEMEIEFVSDINHEIENNETQSVSRDLDTSSNLPEDENLSEKINSPDHDAVNFTFKENSLFFFLNASLEGKIILEKYKRTKTLDYSRLKNIVIIEKINEDPLNYKIKTEDFLQLQKEIIELFPTEDPDFFYVPIVSNEENQSVSARGCLYNYYKIIRSELREAGLLQKTSMKNDPPVQNKNILDSIHNSINCLTDKSRDKYEVTEVMNKWKETYGERMNLLTQKERKIKTVSLEKYFSTFQCLSSPLGTILLEQDFLSYISELVNKNLILQNDETNYSTLISQRWPGLANKIVKYCKTSRIPEIKNFFLNHGDLVEAGTHNSVLALLLLPLAIKSSKTFKVGDAILNVSKEDVTNCFVLHVQESTNINKKQEELETWLKTLNQEVHPYLLLCGKLESAQIYVVLNQEKYIFKDPAKALECCYKCLNGLKAFPYICDFVWSFFDKSVFNFSFRKINSWTTKFVGNINKI